MGSSQPVTVNSHAGTRIGAGDSHTRVRPNVAPVITMGSDLQGIGSSPGVSIGPGAICGQAMSASGRGIASRRSKACCAVTTG